jgi:RNA-directed DNA polymerase
LQRAVAMLLQAIYEEEFHDFSYGFRPARSAHDACGVFQKTAMRMAGGWVLEVDIRKFFDTLDHEHLRNILRRRVRDGVILRLIGKWLNAGVMEDLVLSHPEAGTPQGGVISPLLANIYLHEVLDEWFVHEVLPRLKGRASLVRYADDFVFLFEWRGDAERVFDVLPKRFGRYGLTLHPDKTRMVPFRRPDRGSERPGTFNLLGFTHYWGLSHSGKWVPKLKTAKDRLSRTLSRIGAWCREHRHAAVEVQWQVLSRKLAGHYAYFGVTPNYVALRRVWDETKALWKKWLSRRSQKAYLSWEVMHRLLTRYPLPRPRIVHRNVAQRT